MKKVVDIKEIRVELLDTMGERHKHVIDEDEENLDNDDDVYMYPTDIHLDKQHAYRAAVQASKTSEWNRQQEHFVRGKRKMGICKVEN